MPSAKLKLETVGVQNYCCFQDTSEVRIGDVTVLLAENENGKSSFLRGLEWFGSEEPLDPEDRWDGADEDAVLDIVSLVFSVTPEMAEALIDAGYSPVERVRIMKDSLGGFRVEEAETRRELASHKADAEALFTGARDELIDALRELGDEGAHVSDAIARLEAASGDGAVAQPLAEGLRSILFPTVPSQAEELELLLQAFIDAESSVVGAADDPDSLDVLRAFMPRFLYFADLEDRVQDSVAYSAVDEDPSAHRTMINLAKLVNQDLVEIARRSGHQRLRLAERVSTELTETTSFFWEGDKITFKVGLHDEEMVVLIDHKSRTQPPSRRSRGLQWFLGFHTNFKAEVSADFAGAVLLLDEPGLHLHIKQQPKLVEFLDALSRDNQIVYSTHLPYMIPKSQMDRLRLLVARSNGTVRIVSDIHKVGATHDAWQPVRAALGMGIAHAISLGAKNLIVEGFADDYYVDAMRRACDAAELATLPDDITVLVSGGAGKKMLPLSSFVVSEKTLGAVLLDDDRAGHSAKREIERHLGEHVPIVFTRTPGASPSGESIEDLFERAYFVDLLNDAYADVATYGMVNATDLTPDKPICEAIDEVFEARGMGGFQKLRPARELQTRVRLGQRPPDQATFNAFADLFERLNSALTK